MCYHRFKLSETIKDTHLVYSGKFLKIPIYCGGLKGSLLLLNIAKLDISVLLKASHIKEDMLRILFLSFFSFSKIILSFIYFFSVPKEYSMHPFPGIILKISANSYKTSLWGKTFVTPILLSSLITSLFMNIFVVILYANMTGKDF